MKQQANISNKKRSSPPLLRLGWRMALFFSVIIAIMLSSFSTLVTSNNIDINDNNYVDSSSVEEAAGDVKADRQYSDSTTSSATPKTVTIQIMDPINNLRGLLNKSTGTRNQIWIVLAYRESCEKSMELLWRLRHYAVPKIEFGDDIDSVYDEDLHPTIAFVPMPVNDDEDDVANNDDSNENIMNQLGIVRLPSLFFLLDEEGGVSSMESSEILSEEEEENDNHNDNKNGNDSSVNILAKAQVYHGLSETVDDLVNGLYFYLSRLRLRSQHKHNQRQSQYQNLPLTTIQVESLQELRTIIRNSDGMIHQYTPLPLDPDLSRDEDRWIRYIMDDTHIGPNSIYSTKNDYIYGGDLEGNKEEDDEAGRQQQQQQRTTITTDSFRVVVQCRKKIRNSQIPSPIESYQEFDRVAKVLGARRDVLFSVLEWDDDDNVDVDVEDRNSAVSFCNFRDDDDDGLVAVWDGDGNNSSILAEGVGEPPFSVMSTTTTIVDGLSSWLRPNLLWFDRRFASIAFHPRYRRHAVLFVDFHDRTSATKMRETIRMFRNECRRRRRNSDAETDDAIIVCLVVPSTEIRAMTTFGIDIWTDLDQKATEKIRSIVCGNEDFSGNNCDITENTADTDQSTFASVLPALLVTDRQNDGTIQRHYLDPPINRTSIENFIDNIVHGLTEPERKSSGIHDTINNEHKIPTNKHGIHLLTADSLSPFLKTNNKKHVLVQLYAATCGHCKRFNTIWNSLGDLIEFLGWSDLLSLARIDVSSNEVIIPGMATPTWLPDLFYFGVGVYENPVHYGNTIVADEMELGGISDPLDLIEWWMDNAGDTIDEIELLRELEGQSTGTT